MGQFYCDEFEGDEKACILGFREEGKNTQEAKISLRYGANLCRYSLNGNNIIDYEPELLKTHGFTGTPVLYPTPNRVKNGVFVYNGKAYNQVKRGRRIFEHGLVYDEPWQLVKIGANADSASLSARIDWDKTTPLFEAFPITHTLKLYFRLEYQAIEITYEIKNLGHAELPYGFGLHPYFQKLSGGKETLIRVPVTHVMETTKELLPTGHISPVKDTYFDLNEFSPLDKLNLDHVFLRLDGDGAAAILYLQQGFGVEISSTDDFSYFVIYSPKHTPYFCIEEQTCSTDAHNLYDRGLRDVSGLKFIRSGETKKGTVRYTIKPIDYFKLK